MVDHRPMSAVPVFKMSINKGQVSTLFSRDLIIQQYLLSSVMQPSVSGMDPPFGDAFQNYTFADQALTSTDLLANSSDPDFIYELVRGIVRRCLQSHYINQYLKSYFMYISINILKVISCYYGFPVAGQRYDLSPEPWKRRV